MDFIELQLPVEGPNLKVLKFSGCKVSKLHLGQAPRLEKLILDGCKGFVELQLPFECWNLKVLNLIGSKARHLNLVPTPHRERLYLEECSYLQEIHAPVGCLKKLVYLRLSLCFNFAYFKVDKQHESVFLDSMDTAKVKVHWVDVCPLHPKNNLLRFGFKCEYVEPRSSPSGNVEKLISFGPCACKNREYILEKICDLQYLKVFSAKGNVPRDLWRLESLEMLTLEKQQFQHLSGSICMLKHLKSLELYFCLSLEKLPENIHELESLEHLIILGCESLRYIPNSLYKLKCLKRLQLVYCDNIMKLPEELGALECLKEVRISGAGITTLPRTIYQLKGLCIYGSRKQLELNSFTSMAEFISDHIYWVEL